MVDIMFTMMSWIGAEEESNVPYADFNSGVDESYRYHSYAHLQNVNLYDEKDINSIKEAIMRDGAVQISYYASSNYLTKNSGEYTAYYCPNGYTSNHSITVVGWDDNFSKSNFRTGSTNNDGETGKYSSCCHSHQSHLIAFPCYVISIQQQDSPRTSVDWLNMNGLWQPNRISTASAAIFNSIPGTGES